MKMFWDTNLFIYLWEDCALSETTTQLADIIEQNNHILKTSTLTLGEILVRPMRLGRSDVVTAYRRAFERMPLISFGVAEAVAFASLRAERPSLRASDAVQLSCAAMAECDLFFTNDDRLSEVKVKGIRRVVNLPTWSEALFE